MQEQKTNGRKQKKNINNKKKTRRTHNTREHASTTHVKVTRMDHVQHKNKNARCWMQKSRMQKTETNSRKQKCKMLNARTKNSRKQKSYKENHNARSSNTQTQRTIQQHARMHNAQHIYKNAKCIMRKQKQICITENRYK